MRLPLPSRHRGHRAIEPAAGHAVIGAALQTILRLEMAANAVVAGDRVHDKQLVRLIQRVRIASSPDAARTFRRGRAGPWSLPGGGGTSSGRSAARPGSPYGTTADMPSIAPRRITTTNRCSVGAAATASDSRPMVSTDVRPSSVALRLSAGPVSVGFQGRFPSSPLKFGGGQQQRHRLAARSGMRHGDLRVGPEQRAERGVGRSPSGRGRRSGRIRRTPSRCGASWPRARPSRRRRRTSRSARARSTSGCPRPARMPRNGGLGSGGTSSARKLATTRSSGVRIFVPGVQASFSRTRPAAAAPRSPPVSRRMPSMRRTAAGGGVSATKWHTSLVARNRCVAG